MKETGPIPRLKTFGPLGNLPLLDKDKPTMSLIKLANEQGPIFQVVAYRRRAPLSSCPAMNW